MITEFGHYALVLALAVSLVQMTLPLWGAHKNDSALMGMAEPAALVQFLATGIAFACLTQAFIISDFSVKLVWSHSHSAKPFLYKIAGVWGNHEGSMLLWVLILGLFGEVHRAEADG